MRSDAQLLAAAERDADAFCELYDRHAEAILAWLTRHVPAHAADLMAETFCRAWLHRRSFRDERDGSALPWLYGIARNVHADTHRRRAVEERARRQMGFALRPGAESEELRCVEERTSAPTRELASALASIPESERAAVGLRVVGERSYAEIAELLSIRPAAARLRVSRGLRRLSELLEGRGTTR